MCIRDSFMTRSSFMIGRQVDSTAGVSTFCKNSFLKVYHFYCKKDSFFLYFKGVFATKEDKSRLPDGFGQTYKKDALNHVLFNQIQSVTCEEVSFCCKE